MNPEEFIEFGWKNGQAGLWRCGMSKDKKCPCGMSETLYCDWNIDRDLGLYAPNSDFTIFDRKIIIGTYSANDYMGFIEIDIDYCPLCGISLKEVAE